MCLSAQASFIAGSGLIGLGALSIWTAQSRNTRYLMLAAVPAIFGAQQLAEGAVWLAVHDRIAWPDHWPALVFLFFAYWFWPVWIPLSVASIEPNKAKRNFAIACGLLGLTVGAVYYLPLLTQPEGISVRQVMHSLKYTNPQAVQGDAAMVAGRIIYGLIICVPLLMVTNNPVRIFGVLITLSILICFAVAAYAFVSIWCFVAALLSVYLIAVMGKIPRPAPS